MVGRDIRGRKLEGYYNAEPSNLKGVEGLLVACRAYSSEYQHNEYFNLIPHCIAFGQAAGTAAALAVKLGIKPRDIDFRLLQKHLVSQGVILYPGTRKSPTAD